MNSNEICCAGLFVGGITSSSLTSSSLVSAAAALPSGPANPTSGSGMPPHVQRPRRPSIQVSNSPSHPPPLLRNNYLFFPVLSGVSQRAVREERSHSPVTVPCRLLSDRRAFPRTLVLCSSCNTDLLLERE